MLFQRCIGLTVSLCLLGMGLPAQAQQAASDAQNKLLARRAAEADCYRKLAEAVYGVQVNSETYVRDFVTESDEIRAAVDAVVKGVRLGPPRYYEDGVCEIDGEVTVAKLVTKLREIHATHYEGNRITSTDFESIKKTVRTDVIRATGSGAPRPELPPNLPIGIEDVLTPLPSSYAPPPSSVPALWRTVSPQARLMAQRAAKLDAMRKLLERIKGLRLTSDTLVRDFITESDEIRARAKGIVIGARQVSSYLHDDELIVEVTMAVPVEKIVERVKELHSTHYHGNKVTTTDITNIKRSIQREMIEATGSGVPPARFLGQARSAGVEMPRWMGDRIEAIGEGTDPAFDTAQGKLKAARAAQLDALRKLAEQVYGLEIRSATTVRDFVTEHDEIATQVEAVLRGAVADSATFEGQIATVRVSIPAADVWSVVHQHIVIINRRG